MKKIILAILTLLTLNSYSQNFPENEAIWNRYHSDMFGTLRLTQYLQVGDTMINGLEYNKLYKSYEQYQFDTLAIASHNIYQGALRPDTSYSKIYFIPADSSNEVLLYNFNLQVGDTIPVWHNEFSNVLTIKSIDTIVVNNTALKRFEMDYNKSPNPVFGDFIIEGIGSIKDLIRIENNLEGTKGFICFTNVQTGFKYPVDCNNNMLSIENGQSDNLNTVSIYPNPCDNWFSLRFEGIGNEKHKIEVIDLNGNKVFITHVTNEKQRISTNGIAPGLYIMLLYNDSEFKGATKIIKK